MTKRRILAMIIALALCVSLVACSSKDKSSQTDCEVESLVLISRVRIGKELIQYILYDPDTMVMYSFVDGNYSGGPTVMYNADGTLKLYTPKIEAE